MLCHSHNVNTLLVEMKTADTSHYLPFFHLTKTESVQLEPSAPWQFYFSVNQLFHYCVPVMIIHIFRIMAMQNSTISTNHLCHHISDYSKKTTN